jgi:hypothetical protein
MGKIWGREFGGCGFSAEIGALQGVQPTSGPDVGGMAPWLPAPACTPASPRPGWRYFSASSLVCFWAVLPSAAQIDPRDGSNVLGSSLHSRGLAVSIVGGVIGVARGS